MAWLSTFSLGLGLSLGELDGETVDFLKSCVGEIVKTVIGEGVYVHRSMTARGISWLPLDEEQKRTWASRRGEGA